MIWIILAIIIVGFFIERAISAPERNRKRRDQEDLAKVFRDTEGGGQY